MLIFQANFPKNRASDKGQSTNIEKISPALCSNNDLEFVISSEFLVVSLQRIVPPDKVQCF